jgi:hypothetical protein
MEMKKRDWYRVILGIIVLICLILLFFSGPKAVVTGHATESTTTSNVTIQKYLSITFCANLTAGISFGDVSTLPATNLNGTHNYDDIGTGTTYCVNVSDDGNTAIDFCSKADWGLNTTSGDIIGLDNETYSNYTSSNATVPDLTDEISLTTSYVKSGNAIAVGAQNFYRFWLDIPAAQPSGDYNNTVYFKGVSTAIAC